MERSLLRYERHHRANNSSQKTIQYHRDCIGALLRFLRQRGHSCKLEDLHLDDVLDWIEDQRDRNLSQKTISTRVISVKAFTRWLLAEEWLPKDPLARLKVPKVDDKPKDTLSPDDIDTLLKACDRGTPTGCRDFAMLLLLFSTGLRASELVGLQQTDIDWDTGLITVRRGKGGKYRVLPLGAKVGKALDRYLSHPKRPESRGAVFLTNTGDPAAYKTLQGALIRLEERTGIHANAHRFRHSAAIQYLRGGGQVQNLRAMLGHSTLEMSLHYARVAGVDLTEAHMTADPARSLKVRV